MVLKLHCDCKGSYMHTIHELCRKVLSDASDAKTPQRDSLVHAIVCLPPCTCILKFYNHQSFAATNRALT